MWGDTDDAKPRRFRWRFDLPEGLKDARVTVSAKDSLAGLWLDGVPLIKPGDRTAWGQGPASPCPTCRQARTSWRSRSACAWTSRAR